MVDKVWPHHIILVISRRGIISFPIRGRGSRGTNEVNILIVIIIVFRISTKVVVDVGIIIVVVFRIIIVVDGNVVVAAKAPLDIVIFGVVFSYSIRLASSRGRGTVIIRLRKEMKMVTFEIIINVVFGNLIAAIVVVVNCEGPTLNPAVWIIIIGVIDDAKVLFLWREESWSLLLELLLTLFLEFG